MEDSEDMDEEETQDDEQNLQHIVKEVVKNEMAIQEETVTGLVREVLEVQRQRQTNNTRDQIRQTLKQSKEQTYNFKKEGNSSQYQHQMDVLDAVEETERAVLDKDGGKAKAHIDNGKKIFFEQMQAY